MLQYQSLGVNVVPDSGKCGFRQSYQKNKQLKTAELEISATTFFDHVFHPGLLEGSRRPHMSKNMTQNTT